MRINIKSNFVIPGVEDDAYVSFNRSELTLRAFLDALSERSQEPWSYIEPGADMLDPSDWDVRINAVPYQNFKEKLEKELVDGDTVTLLIVPQGGG